MKKRGQVTVFIIVAIVVVALAVGIYFLYPRTTSNVVSATPAEEIKGCLESDLADVVEKVSAQGGAHEPDFSFNYNGDLVEYLCYTNEYYKTCVMQKPLLKNYIESEIKNAISERVDECFNSLQNNYEKKGFDVSVEKNGFDVGIVPNEVSLNINYVVTLTKGGSDKYENFEVNSDSHLYKLTNIAEDILDWEAQYGDADVSSYMLLYSWIKAEKFKQTGGTTVYVLTHRDSGDKFIFASRSVAWPPGYEA